MTTKFKLFILLILYVYSAPELIAQNYPLFEKINVSDGLSNGRINSIVRDTSGFVWIGTQNGLNRYDGHDFKVYTNQNSVIKSNDISKLFLDSKNRLWVATRGGGLNLYNEKLDTFEVFKSSEDPESLVSNQVNTIFEDSSGTLWLGTENGVSSYNEKTNSFSSIQHSKNGLSHNSITSISQMNKATLWIATFGGGLNKLNLENQQIKPITSSKTHFSSFIYTIYKRDEKNLLLGTSGGLLNYNTNTGVFSNYFQDLGVDKEVNIVRAITRDRSGTLWIGTDGNGLIKIKENAEPVVTENFQNNPRLTSSISGNAIYDITEDSESNLWIGTSWNGLNLLDYNKNYDFLSSDIKGIDPFPVLSIFQDGPDLYLGTDGNGLTTYNTNTRDINYFNEKNESYIGGNYIQSIVKQESSENLWLGTFTNGLISFNPVNGDYRQYDHDPDNPESISYNDVRDIITKKNGDLWVATWGGGLNYFNNATKTFRRYYSSGDKFRSINNDNVIALQREGDKIWIATFGGGLNLYNTKDSRFEYFKYDEINQNSPSSNNLFALLTDSSGLLWIGTSGSGINTYNPQSGLFNRFAEEKRLQHTSITAILEDNEANIWFSTKSGIWRYNRKQDEFTTFPIAVNNFHINSTYKNTEGDLFFGGASGIIRINPANIEYKDSAPKVVLTGFKLFNEKLSVSSNKLKNRNIAYENELILDHDADVIIFEFAALKFPSSDNCEYAIKLENFDKEWRTVGTDRTATFTNLAPGDYIFKVKSKEKWSQWDQNFTSVKLTILKPFWLQWWAFCVYVILILALLYLFRKYVIKWEQMKSTLEFEKFAHEKDKEFYVMKQQFFTNISHEIRNPVTLLLGATNQLAKNYSVHKKGQFAPVDIIQKHGRHLLYLVDELLDFKNPEFEGLKLKVEKLNWVFFCQEIFHSFKTNVTAKNIEFKWEARIDEVHICFDKNQMRKVLYNLLTNALKFTPEGGEIKLIISVTNDEVELRVRDTGIGLSKKHQQKIFQRSYQTKKSRSLIDSGHGLGLYISKEIVDLHSGKLYVESEKNKGSTFILKLLKGREHFAEHEFLNPSENDKQITMPVINKHNSIQENEPGRADTSILKGKNLLIVEDDKEVREYIAGIFREMCIVVQAQNGIEALKLLEIKQPDLIVSDIMMPGMNGVNLTTQLKANPETSHIPVILLTARATSDQQIEGYKTGADAYITKPFSENILKLKVINLIRSRDLLKKKFDSEKSILPSNLEINSSEEKFLEDLLEIVRNNISNENLDATLISRKMGMSHSAIYKKIKSLTGMTYVEFIRDFKLKIAGELIAEKGFSVSEACYKIGYSDRKYFSKLFKKKFGSNPSKYTGDR